MSDVGKIGPEGRGPSGKASRVPPRAKFKVPKVEKVDPEGRAKKRTREEEEELEETRASRPSALDLPKGEHAKKARTRRLEMDRAPEGFKIDPAVLGDIRQMAFDEFGSETATTLDLGVKAPPRQEQAPTPQQTQQQAPPDQPTPPQPQQPISLRETPAQERPAETTQERAPLKQESGPPPERARRTEKPEERRIDPTKPSDKEALAKTEKKKEQKKVEAPTDKPLADAPPQSDTPATTHAVGVTPTAGSTPNPAFQMLPKPVKELYRSMVGTIAVMKHGKIAGTKTIATLDRLPKNHPYFGAKIHVEEMGGALKIELHVSDQTLNQMKNPTGLQQILHGPAQAASAAIFAKEAPVQQTQMKIAPEALEKQIWNALCKDDKYNVTQFHVVSLSTGTSDRPVYKRKEEGGEGQGNRDKQHEQKEKRRKKE